MLHYWWLFAVGLFAGFYLGTVFVKKGTMAALRNAERLEAERDRLKARIQYIGERKADGGVQI